MRPCSPEWDEAHAYGSTITGCAAPTAPATQTPPVRVQLSRAAGWRMPANTVKVDRTTCWGNPYRVGVPVDLDMAARWGFRLRFTQRQARDNAHAVALFSSLFLGGDLASEVVRRDLRGKNLACWCPAGEPCHADVLLRIANTEYPA